MPRSQLWSVRDWQEAGGNKEDGGGQSTSPLVSGSSGTFGEQQLLPLWPHSRGSYSLAPLAEGGQQQPVPVRLLPASPSLFRFSVLLVLF